MKRKLFFVLIISILCFSVTGCSFLFRNKNNDQETTSTQVETTAETENPFEITVVYNDVTDSVNASDGTILINYLASFPEFSIVGYENSAENINDYYVQMNYDFIHFIQNTMSDANLEYTNNAGDPNFPWREWEIENTFEMVRGDESVISVKETDYYYYGGAHPGTTYRADNFSTQTGNLLLFDDIFSDPGDAHSQITNYILDLMTSPDYAGSFFDDYVDLVAGIDMTDRWYFSESGLVVIFNEYEIAPYAAGPFEFTIPYGELDYLLDEYI